MSRASTCSRRSPRRAIGPVEEGSVGGGTGMICHGFKGGIGTSSRVVEVDGGPAVGRRARPGQSRPPSAAAGERRPGRRANPGCGGSDSTLSDARIVAGARAAAAGQRLDHRDRRRPTRPCRRASAGGSRSGRPSAWRGWAVPARTRSGDLFLAFATANRVPLRGEAAARRGSIETLGDGAINDLFYAVIDATEEAILNALLAAGTMVGRDGITAHGLDGAAAAAWRQADVVQRLDGRVRAVHSLCDGLWKRRWMFWWRNPFSGRRRRRPKCPSSGAGPGRGPRRREYECRCGRADRGFARAASSQAAVGGSPRDGSPRAVVDLSLTSDAAEFVRFCHRQAPGRLAGAVRRDVPGRQPGRVPRLGSGGTRASTGSVLSLFADVRSPMLVLRVLEAEGDGPRAVTLLPRRPAGRDPDEESAVERRRTLVRAMGSPERGRPRRSRGRRPPWRSRSTEYRRRLEATERAVDAAGLDALLTVPLGNVCWLSGFQTLASYSFALYGAPRPARSRPDPPLVGLREPQRVARLLGRPTSARTASWTTRRLLRRRDRCGRTWPVHGSASRRATAHSRSSSSSGSAIACRRRDFVDGDGTVERLRAVKSAEELDVLREAARISSAGMRGRARSGRAGRHGQRRRRCGRRQRRSGLAASISRSCRS